MKRDNPPLSRRALLAVTARALALSACQSVLPGQGPPPRLYRLTPKSSYPGAPTVDWQLVVEPPSAQASIDTPRIGLMLSPLRFDYYAQANWVDRAPLMVQSLIIESFDNSRAIIAVGRESIGLRPDYVLKTELREFQAEVQENQHLVNVALHVKLVQMPERQIVASAESVDTITTLKPDLKLDAWNNPIRYEITGTNSYELQSAGPDGNWNTADDIELPFTAGN